MQKIVKGREKMKVIIAAAGTAGLAIAGAATAEEAEADGTILVHVIPG